MIRSLRRRHRGLAWVLLAGSLLALAAAITARPAPLGPGPVDTRTSPR